MSGKQACRSLQFAVVIGKPARYSRRMKNENLNKESWLVTAGRSEQPGDPLNQPMVPASNFIIGKGREYSRDGGNPGWEALEEIMGGLEHGQALAFASGMAAISAVFSLLPRGAHVVIPEDCYQGVAMLAQMEVERGVLKLTRCDVTQTENWIDLSQSADMLWLESPTNPLLDIADVARIAGYPRKPRCLLVVDNTFATPLNQQPLMVGADICVHSATKFIGGHSDLLCGITVSRDPSITDALRRQRKLSGATPGVLECFLATRGARTLALRLERAQQNAMAIAEWLQQQDVVESVRYPGLSRHPGHELATEQLGGYGTIVTFVLRSGADAADSACESVQLIRHATSLGSVETTMERRSAVKGQEHLPPGMLRLSVGVEHCDDLISDLRQALLSPGIACQTE